MAKTTAAAARTKTVAELDLACDEYLSTLVQHINSKTGPDAAVDVARAEDNLRSALTGHSQADVDSAIALARDVVTKLEASISSISPSYARNSIRGQLGSVRFRFDALITEFDTSALIDAEAKLQAAEDALSDARVQMEGAINGGDVDRVLELRTDLELRLPAAVEQARVVVLDNRILEAEAQSLIPLCREATRLEREKALQRDLELAHTALGDAQLAQQEFYSQGSATANAANMATSQLESLKNERERAVSAAAVDQETRLRALAGLPPKTQSDGHDDGSLIRPESSIDGRLIEVMA